MASDNLGDYERVQEEGKYSLEADIPTITFTEIGKRGIRRLDGYEKASGKAEHAIASLSGRLGQIGLQDKLHFCTVAPRYPEELNRELEQFSQKMESVGSNGSMESE